jgi:glycosyltransferase involved in cell wall biosynthesis
MNKKIRVLMVLNRYYPMIGGAENQCRMLLKSLKSYPNIETVGIVTHKYDENLSEYESIDGDKIFRIGRCGNNKVSIINFYISLFYFLVKNRKNFDVIHVHTISITAFICVFFSKLFSKKTLQKLTISEEIQSMMSRKGIKGFVQKTLITFSLKNAFIVALTNEGIQEIKKYCPVCSRNYFKINNGVDDTIFFKKMNNKELKNKYNFREDYYYFGFVGRLTQVKGILELAKFFDEFTKKYPERKMKLAILGSGDFQIDSVERDIKNISLINDNIVLLPSEHQPVDFYNAIDFYISNSTKEGMPNTVLEALSCEKAVILSNIKPHLEIADENKKASIYIFKNFIELEQILVNLEKENKITSKINENFTITNVAQSYANLYNEFI